MILCLFFPIELVIKSRVLTISMFGKHLGHCPDIINTMRLSWSSLSHCHLFPCLSYLTIIFLYHIITVTTLFPPYHHLILSSYPCLHLTLLHHLILSNFTLLHQHDALESIVISLASH